MLKLSRIPPEVHPGECQKIFSVDIVLAKMIKQVVGQVRELQRKLAETQKERNLLRLQPCQGDPEIRQKEGKISCLGKSIDSLNPQIRELEKKRREMMSEAIKKPGYEFPFS